MLESKVGGFEDAHKLLKELPVRVQRNVLQTATRDTLKEVALKPIKAAAPRHDGKRSQKSKQYGTLFANIRVAKLRRVRKGEKGARISTGNAFWGFIYEKGSRHQAARPWFAPKFRMLEGNMIKTLADKIGLGIEKEVEKSYRGPR